ncbi:MAG TPA: trypsin-like peptidase domain-containing protein [Jatrophihabitans sp.]
MPPGYLPPGGGFGPQPPRPPAKPVGRKTVVVAAVIAAVIGGGIGAGTAAALSDGNSGNGGLIFNGQSTPSATQDGSVAAAAAKIGPSVVTINIVTSQEQGTGSGVVIRKDGYILTNNHVVSGATGNGDISVVLSDGEREPATIVGVDVSDDLAVVKINTSSQLTAAEFAKSSDLQVGQTVVAVGAPLGLSDTVTAGIVSNTARPVTTGGDTNSDTAIFNAVQTDAAINPGNSGGPLVNLNGSVVGINSAIATDAALGGSSSGNIGIGFAIPSDEASRIAAELIANGKATHALLGISVGDQNLNGTATGSVGALVKDVSAGGPADKAGLKNGDVVTELDGQRIDTSDALVAAVRSHAPNTEVSLTYLRNGESKTVQVTLGEQSS